MTAEDTGPKINPGDIIFWPMLKLDYDTSPSKLAALLPPGIEPGLNSQVHLTVYNFPVPDVPEYGILITVDADYNGEQGLYTLGYGIDQESAIFISRDMNGQPKFPCEVEYYRMGARVRARCIHQGYTFLEFEGVQTGAAPLPETQVETEWWIKVSRAVGGAEKAYDFPPHVVKVHSRYQPVHREMLEGELRLLDSPWDPIARLLPMEGEASAYLSTAQPTARDITLEGPLDPDAFWPFVDTLGGSRWPGTQGGPRR